ncbi:MAG: methylated-DNA--[protein]-cysteine S-methyltransferase [Lachnospiraceae bacterium]|nr:methylated-DNA--[protein]-cysteine S-methyltransferase [Lachnospiraceae bacterium]
MIKKNVGIIHRTYYDSPIGRLCLEDDGEALTGLYLTQEEDGEALTEPYLTQEGADRKGAVMANLELSETDSSEKQSEIALCTCTELDEYFTGRRKVFDIPLHLYGTEFQLKVWNALREIPYGETRTYSDIAAEIGQPLACRAVGGANNKNPILLLVPCHRVIGKDGGLTGFACGLHVKEYLLKMEKEKLEDAENP